MILGIAISEVAMMFFKIWMIHIIPPNLLCDIIIKNVCEDCLKMVEKNLEK